MPKVTSEKLILTDRQAAYIILRVFTAISMVAIIVSRLYPIEVRLDLLQTAPIPLIFNGLSNVIVIVAGCFIFWGYRLRLACALSLIPLAYLVGYPESRSALPMIFAIAFFVLLHTREPQDNRLS